jgi:hypothetical protein
MNIWKKFTLYKKQFLKNGQSTNARGLDYRRTKDVQTKWVFLIHTWSKDTFFNERRSLLLDRLDLEMETDEREDQALEILDQVVETPTKKEWKITYRQMGNIVIGIIIVTSLPKFLTGHTPRSKEFIRLAWKAN